MATGNLDRVVVVGSSGCGKSRFARDLAQLLGQPSVELDELCWAPNWIEKPENEFRRLVSAAAEAPRWVVDGNYSRMRDVLWTRATTIVWLNFGFLTVFLRALRRTIHRILTNEPLWHGNRESAARSFFSRDSILLYVISTFLRRRRNYTALRASGKYPHLSWIEFRRPADASRFLAALKEMREHPPVQA
jgi:adenylate kinase family enzyme